MTEFQKKLKEFSPYLQDIFQRIYVLTIAFVVFFVFGFIFSGSIIKILSRIFDFPGVVLAATSPFQLVDLAMNTGLLFAVTGLTPLLLYHFYDFVGSGLKREEKKIFFVTLPIIIGLFVVGFLYGFYTLRYATQAIAILNISLGVQNLWNINTFLTQIATTSAFLGLIFEFPLVVTALVKFGIINVSFLKKHRRHVIFVILILTSLLPPTDGISLLVMVSPLIVMYELTILYNQFAYRQLTAKT